MTERCKSNPCCGDYFNCKRPPQFLPREGYEAYQRRTGREPREAAMASEGKSLRRIIEDAIQQIETFKNPDVTEAEGVLSDLIKAAGLGDIRGETLAYVSIRDGNVAVRTEYYSRGGSCGEHYDFPEAIIDAADPIATAKEWGLRRKVAKLERERDEARSALAHYEERLATAQSALDAFLSPALNRLKETT